MRARGIVATHLVCNEKLGVRFSPGPLNKKNMQKQKIFFVIIFTVLSLVAFQVPISKIIGSGQSFTLFELIAPIGGMFLGPLFGAVSAFFVRFANIVLFKQNLE